jgi:hypothetical protein
MIKIMSLVKTREGASLEAFREYWRGPYLSSILALDRVKPGVVKVTHNHAIPLVLRDDHPASTWAGVGEMWFDRQADAEAFLNHPGLAGVLASHANVLTEVVQLPCTELPTWDLGAENPPIKMIAFFHPSAAMTRAQSQDYWTNKHVAVGMALNKPQRFAPRYVQNHVLPDFHTADPAYDFAGAPELWFYSKEAALQLFGETDKLEELQADEAKFSDRPSTVALITDELLVYSRTAGLVEA